jgi:polyisoprenoid-binding protein YceI
MLTSSRIRAAAVPTLRRGLAALLWAAAPYNAAAQEYHVDVQADNIVRFISEATIEDFEGVTERIDGFIVLPDGGLARGSTAGSEFYLEVDLGSVDTGIGLRNRHMRDNYLETDRYPYATFSGVFAGVDEGDDGWTRVTGSGDLGIHGVSRTRDIVCEVAPAGSGFRARCSFEVLLSDFDIEIPKVMFMKLANEIRLELDFYVALADVEGETP